MLKQSKINDINHFLSKLVIIKNVIICFDSNCKFLIRNHPRQAKNDKINFFPPHILNRIDTQQPTSRIEENALWNLWFGDIKSIFWGKWEHVPPIISLFMNQVLVDPIESDKTSVNLCWFDLISWPIGFAAGI